ncbi:unnamed protein product [Cylindrotheca closterium]|uniref:DOMON domain-containing protein n=1 Tax=Cylindrotheca closterium TaxID=2856 RepID=A0AAD2JGG4_9STRA|nr:unnamed protein product [Cylindrotheca closterium]
MMMMMKHQYATFLITLLLASVAQSQVELCRNTDWVDDDGCGCEEYDFNQEWCELYGDFVFEGESANTACCACGGGRTIFIDAAETDPPIVLGEKNCIFSPPVEVAPGLTVENWVDNDELTFRMRLTYEGKSWIGISFENDGRPGKPTFAVIGRQEDNESSVKKYTLNTANPDASGVVEMPQGSQTLEDVQFFQTNTRTVMTFTKTLNEIFDIPEQVVTDRSTWIYAVGLPDNAWTGAHTIHGKFNLALNPCFTNPWEITNPSVNGGLVDGNAVDRRTFFGVKPNKTVWIAHGISLGIAWGIIAPLGLASAFLKRKGPFWGKVNQFANTTLLLLTCAGILLGVVATYLDDRSNHLQTDHSLYGVGVFGGLLVYCMMALYFGAKATQKEKQEAEARARKKGPPARVVKPKVREPDVILGMGDGLEIVPGDSPHNPKNKNKKKQSLYSEPVEPPPLEEEEEATPPEKAGCLEWFSRFLFLALIALAYYTCHSGIDWQTFLYGLDWSYYYWGVGAFGIVMMLLLILLSCCMKDASSKKVAPSNSRSAPGSPERESAPKDGNNDKITFAKGVDEDSYYTPSGRDSYDDTTTLNTGQLMEEDDLEDKEAQRSPMRKSWAMDTCCL